MRGVWWWLFLFLNFHKKRDWVWFGFFFFGWFWFFFFGFFFKLLDSLKRVLWCFFLCGFLDKNNLKNKFFYLNSRQQRTYRLFIFFVKRRLFTLHPLKKKKNTPGMWALDVRPLRQGFSLCFFIDVFFLF
jgi:hypothetical protein